VTLQLRLEALRLAPLKTITTELAIRSQPIEWPASSEAPTVDSSAGSSAPPSSAAWITPKTKEAG